MSRDEQVVALARTALRTVGPRFTALDDAAQDASVASRHCRRFPDHEGNHRAYVFSIVTPDEWENPRE